MICTNTTECDRQDKRGKIHFNIFLKNIEFILNFECENFWLSYSNFSVFKIQNFVLYSSRNFLLTFYYQKKKKKKHNFTA